MLKKTLMLTMVAFFLVSCSTLNSISKNEPVTIVVTATTDTAAQATVTEQPTAEPTAKPTSKPTNTPVIVMISKPFSAKVTELAGPFTDSLIRNDNTHVAAFCADVMVQDFSAKVTFTSLPVFNSFQNSFAFFFRSADANDQYRLVVYRTGWALFNTRDIDNVAVNSGELDMIWDEHGNNTFELYAIGDTGYFYLNGYPIFKLDLSARVDYGDVCVVSSVFNENRYGVVTEFKDFQVWALDPQ